MKLASYSVSQLIILVCLGFFNSPHTFGEGHPSSPLIQYIHKLYTSDDGLPQNRSRAILQTRDGFLWIGTQDGLARFDGATFHIYSKENTPALKHNDITTLYESDDGDLWIGTFNGLTQLRNGKFISHAINTGPVRGISGDSNGNLWIGTMHRGIYHCKDGIFDSITSEQGLANNSLNTLATDRQGNLWVALSGMGLAVYQRGQWTIHNQGNGFSSNSVRSFYAASDSAMWIGTENGLVKWKNDLWKVYSIADGLSDNTITTLYVDRSGVLWIGTERGGICRLENNIFTSYRSTDGLSSDYVSAITEDREGCLWIGTFNAGLNQFWKGKFFNLTKREGVPDCTIRAMLTAHDGKIYIGSEGGSVIFFDEKNNLHSLKNDLPSDYIRSLFEDSQHMLWIGLREGLARYGNGSLRIYTTKDGLQQNFIRVMAEDGDKIIWAGTYNGGIHRLENGRFVSYYNKGLPIKAVRSILVDHDSAVWIGSDEGLFRWRHGTVTTYMEKDGLPVESIFDMMEDRNHVIWMGSYGGGLVRMKDNKFIRYTVNQGLSNDVVFKILEDNDDNLWFSSMRGISCVNKHMLNDYADGKIDRIHCILYTSSDGMIASECTGPTGCNAPDGRLWFPTSKGIVIVDPRNIPKNSLPPLVIIERVVIDREDYSPYESVRYHLGDGQVEFNYGGLSFIAPQKVNFRYMLEGFEKEWRYVGSRHEAFYTNLSPGKYIFRVSACNSDGIWNETGASFTFELLPHFYQTIWFSALFLIVCGGTIYGVHRLRVWQYRQREKYLEQHVLERTKQLEVANQDLEAFSYSVSHDLRTPLRSINGFSAALLEDYTDRLDEQGKDFLQRVRAASRHMEQLMDDILSLSRAMRKDMQRSSVNLSDLVQSIANELSRAQPDRKVTFSIAPGLVVQADSNLMEIVLENLLDNAWKFSSKHPTARIEFGCVEQNGQKVYFVRDDGDGFDMAFAGKLFGAFQRFHSSDDFKGTGIGLTTVRRIIHRHSGEVWAEAEKNKGATFYFTVP